MKKLLILIIFCILIVSCNPFKGINGLINNVDYELEKQNDNQRYDRLKQVEDTARAMISSYESDKQIYLVYLKNNEEIALQAKIRANSTAIKYNEYILKNSYRWKDNVPFDIKKKLELIE